MPVALNGSPGVNVNGGVVPGSTLERQLLSIEASKRAQAAGELPPPKASARPQQVAMAAAAMAARRSRSRSGSPAAAVLPAQLPLAAAAVHLKTEPVTPAAAGAPAVQMDGNGAATPQGGSPDPASALNRAAEDSLLAQGNAIKAKRAQLALAFGRPWAPPPAPPDHRTYLCQEAAWLAVDFAQERLWKRVAAKSIAFAAAASRRARTLKAVPPPVAKCGDKLGKVVGEAALERTDSAGRRAALTRTGSRALNPKPSRASGKGRNAAATAAVAEDDAAVAAAESDEGLGPVTPPSLSEGALLYYGAVASAAGPALRSHLQAQLEARIVASRLAVRAWEDEYAAAREERAAALRLAASEQYAAAAGSAETAAGTGMFSIDDMGAAGAGRRSSSRRERQRRGRGVPNYALAEEDVEWDTEDAPAPRPRAPLQPRRPPPLSRGADEPPAGTRVSERQAGRKRRAEAADLDDFEPGGRRPHRRTQPPPRLAAGRDRRALPGRRGDGGQDLGWTKEEDELLAAVVHEFGENYRLVAEVMSPAAAITGTHRNFKACAERFKKLVEAASAQRGDEAPPSTTAAAVAVLGMHKALARTLIAQTLPAPESALRSRIDILVDIGSRARDRRLAHQEAARQGQRTRAEPHPSQNLAVQRVMAQSGGQQLDPLRIAGVSPMAAAGPMVFPAMGPGALQPAGSFPPLGPPPAAAMGPPGTPRLQGAGSGLGMPGIPSPGAPPPAAAAGQLPGGAAMPGAMQQPQQPPAAQQKRGMSSADLQRILATNRAPNGQPITESQRNQIVTQLRLRRQQQQLQHMLQHGTPQQQEHARQVMAQLQKQREAQAAAALQARSQTPNGMASQQQMAAQQPPQQQQAPPPGTAEGGPAAGAPHPAPGQQPGTVQLPSAGQPQQQPPPLQQPQMHPQQQQLRPPLPQPGMQQPSQMQQQPSMARPPLQQQPPQQSPSLPMPAGGTLAAVGAPRPLQQQPQGSQMPGQQLRPPMPQSLQGGLPPPQPPPTSAAATAAHLAASQATLLAQQRQRAAMQQQQAGMAQQPGLPQPPQPGFPQQQQLPLGGLPPGSVPGMQSVPRPTLQPMPRPGLSAMPVPAMGQQPGGPQMQPRPLGSVPLPQQAQPRPGAMPGQGLMQPGAPPQPGQPPQQPPRPPAVQPPQQQVPPPH